MNKYYLAPMEGITGYIYRKAYHEHFTPMDKYFTPFLVPNQSRKFKTKELNDILPEHNRGMYTVPQIMTNCANDFLFMAKRLEDLGYREVNLNLGCPSKTVVSKFRGAGFLANTEALDRFFETVFAKAEIKISVKTRLGKTDSEEFYRLLEIYNQYPLEELIIHPRLQTDYYRNTPDLELFEYAKKHTRLSLCYNGDLFTRENFQAFSERFPDVKTMMLGRGILINPDLVGVLAGRPMVEKTQLRAFHDRIYEDYRQVLSGEQNVLFKMKELWFYLIHLFDTTEKDWKRIRKTQRLCEYHQVVNSLFTEKALVLRENIKMGRV